MKNQLLEKNKKLTDSEAPQIWKRYYFYSQRFKLVKANVS